MDHIGIDVHKRESQIYILAVDTLVSALRPLVSGADTSVIVAVDSAAPSGVVVQAMLKARDAGAEHFLFAIQHQ
jgi:biopolymer transport protein ExbD